MGSPHAQALEILNQAGHRGAIKQVRRVRAWTADSARPDSLFALHRLQNPTLRWQYSARRRRRNSREFGHDARPLRGAGGFKGCERGGHQERLSQAREETASGCQQERSQGGRALRRAQRRLRDRWRRGQAQGIRSRRDRCRRQAALPGLRRRRRAAGQGGRPGWGAHFESFQLWSGRFPPLRGGGGGAGFEDLHPQGHVRRRGGRGVAGALSKPRISRRLPADRTCMRR